MIAISLVLTDLGKRMMAGSLIYEDNITNETFSCFNVRWFQVGSGGVDGGTVLAPDPTRTSLVTPIAAMPIPEDVKSARINEFNCPLWVCELGAGVSGNLSEIGLWGKTIISIDTNGVPTYSTTVPPFLFAYGTFGERAKGASETEIFEISVQF